MSENQIEIYLFQELATSVSQLLLYQQTPCDLTSMT